MVYKINSRSIGFERLFTNIGVIIVIMSIIMFIEYVNI